MYSATRASKFLLKCAVGSTWCQTRTVLKQTGRLTKSWDRKTRLPEQELMCNNHWGRTFSTHTAATEWSESFELPEAEFDWSYLCDRLNLEVIKENIRNRKGVGDIDKVILLRTKYLEESEEAERERLRREMLREAALIPNSSHPDSPVGGEENAKVIHTSGARRDFPFTCKSAVELGEKLGVLRTRNVVLTSGERSYYFVGDLALLEQALIKYTLNRLLKQNFSLVSVPDLIHPSVVEGCGFPTTGERTQVYSLDNGRYGKACLSGTAEMPLAGYFCGQVLDDSDLPQKLCAVSRCYRAETSNIAEEAGIYRVHQFTKVEMFGVTRVETGHESSQLLQHFLSLQQQLFSDLHLHYRVLDMPSQELGAPAHRKYDIEAWMPAKSLWGEISSSSNCTDYQSRRLGIKYQSGGVTRHAHTINGTACAVPRMIIAILENGQNKDGSVDLPEVLWPYLNGVTKLEKTLSTSPTTWIKKVVRP